MKVFNTMSRSIEDLVPIEPGRVRMYTCGPTVYNYAHIGNFRAYIFEDLLRRYLKYRGFAVTQVMNLTDVDDKTIKGALAAGVSLTAFTQPYKEAFFADLKQLYIEPAEHYPAATDHVAAMIEIIQTLIQKGQAYQSSDKSVYFSIDTYPGYGRLAHLDRAGMRAGARVAQDEYDKDNVADFALWKAWDEKDGDIAWDSPWGRGRPGWHIECSAMSMKYLGHSFDLHTGGVDNIFPHHEDEIAQSECATGKTFANYWMHCAHLVVEGKKMSKSLGNFYTLRDILEKGYTGREIRYVLISAQYRQSLNFTFDALEAARSSLSRLDDFRTRLEGRQDGRGIGVTPSWVDKARNGFEASLDHDLNIPEALAALFDMVHDGNRAMDHGGADWDPAKVTEFLASVDTVLGCLSAGASSVDAEAELLMAQRTEARATKNWPEADRIRKRLAEIGWEVRDTPQGPKLKKL